MKGVEIIHLCSDFYHSPKKNKIVRLCSNGIMIYKEEKCDWKILSASYLKWHNEKDFNYFQDSFFKIEKIFNISMDDKRSVVLYFNHFSEKWKVMSSTQFDGKDSFQNFVLKVEEKNYSFRSPKKTVFYNPCYYFNFIYIQF